MHCDRLKNASHDTMCSVAHTYVRTINIFSSSAEMHAVVRSSQPEDSKLQLGQVTLGHSEVTSIVL